LSGAKPAITLCALQEPIMSIIAWIVLGLVAGMIARAVVPGKDSHGLVITTLLGVGGALLGGYLATKLFHVTTTRGFFNISTWITAVVGAAILLLAYHLVTGQRGGRRSRRRFGRWAHR
jgi:uncharacterized membrane protein YeaQ/YmgE (transglycosylase-associated protein family)